MSKIFVRIVIVLVIGALIVLAFSLQVQTNNLLSENKELEKERDEINYTNEQLEKELEREIDDEYVKKVAEDELDLIPPNSKIYYTD